MLSAGPAAALAEEVLRLEQLNEAASLLRRAAPTPNARAAA
ncbi:hypothetical protein ACFQU7_23620 [Pseudoroseomonas wenyumeiae]